MRKLLDPRRLWTLGSATYRIVRDGGPSRVELLRVEGPDGYLLPSMTAVIDVRTREGTSVELEPTLPLPPLYVWGWRVARWLDAPLIGAIEPARLRASIRVPGGG